MIYKIPSYLKDKATEVNNKILTEIHRNYGEYSTAFKFNAKFKSLVRTWLTEYDDFGLTIWGINSNNEKICIFNPMENGYDSLFDFNFKEQEDFNSTKTIDFEKEIDLIVAFQYSGEEAEYVNEGKSKFAEDYFAWFVLYKYDNSKLEEIVSIECA